MNNKYTVKLLGKSFAMAYLRERDKAEPQSTTEYSRVVIAEQRDASLKTRVGGRVDRSKRSYLQPIEGML